MAGYEMSAGGAALDGPALVIVAHPDDETLWAGGLMLMNPACGWTVLCLCRARDADRAPRFAQAMRQFGAAFAMADLDDGPEQVPLPSATVCEAIRRLLPETEFALAITHSPRGEYTRHRRHEEVGRAVATLWANGPLAAEALWMFAYDDGKGSRLPRATASAHRTVRLPDDIAEGKRRIITDVYGFGRGSFEARTAPTTEAFWCFDSPAAYEQWESEEGSEA